MTQETAPARHDCVFINGLEIMMEIGAYPEEFGRKQRVIVDLKAWLKDRHSLSDKDELDTVVSYDDIRKDIEDIAAKGHIKLVETFAERIVDRCFAHFPRIAQIRVKITKPDIILHAAGVGVEIRRSRE